MGSKELTKFRTRHLGEIAIIGLQLWAVQGLQLLMLKFKSSLPWAKESEKRGLMARVMELV